MDIYGNPDDILTGGTVEGDLEIKGNLDIDGDVDVSGTLTTDVFVSRESVETKDALLHLAVDNVADNSNLGTFWEYQDGVKKYGGLVRDKTSKKIRAFKDTTTKPLPSSDISTFPLASFECDGLDASAAKFTSVEISPWTATGAGTNLTFAEATGRGAVEFVNFGAGNHGICVRSANNGSQGAGIRTFRSRGTLAAPTALANNDVVDERVGLAYNGSGYHSVGWLRWRARGIQTPTNSGSVCEFDCYPLGSTARTRVLKLQTDGVTVGTDADGYQLPTTRGTDTQILKTDGSGVVTWEDSPFDQTLDTTDNARFNSLATGTTTSDGLTVLGSQGFSFFSRWFNGNGGVGISTNRYRGTQAAPLAILNNDTLYAFINNGYDGTQLIQGTSFRSFANQDWSVGNNGTCFEIDITRLNETGRVPYFRLDSLGATIGDIDAGLEYRLPPTRGTNGQVLKTDGSGIVNWVDSPDQPLNTNDDVTFSAVDATVYSLSLNQQDGINLGAYAVGGPGTESMRIFHNLVGAVTNIAEYDKNKIVFDVPLESQAITCNDFTYDNGLSALLQVNDGFVFHDRGDDTKGGVGLRTRKSRGTLAAPTAVLFDDKLKSIIVDGHNGSAYVQGGAIQFDCSENWSVGNTGTNLIFDITPKTTSGRIPWFTIADDYFELGDRDGGTAYKLPAARGQYEQVLRTDQSGNVSWSSPGKYCKTDAFQTLTNSVAETSMIGTGQGNLTLAQVNAGDNYHVKISGTIATESKLDEIAFRIDVGNEEVFETTFINLAEVKSNNAFELEVDVTARTSGANAEWYSSGVFLYSANNGAGENDGKQWISEKSVVSAGLVFPATIDLTAQWTIASVDNILIVKQVIITKTF